jgi:AcrR family transcriptional regulator
MGKTTDRASIKPRRDPSQARSNETMSWILEAAARVLEKGGINSFGTRAVADRAGVSIGALYRYFPNKEALMVALFRRESERLLREMEASKDDPTWHSSMSRMLRAMVVGVLSRPSLARILIAERERRGLGIRNKRISDWMQNIVMVSLSKPGAPPLKNRSKIALDMMWVAKAISDAAAERGDTDIDDVTQRVEAAIFGFAEAQSAREQAK